MAYKISSGIAETELSDWLKAAAKKYGYYQNSGVNYKDAKLAPIVMCTVKAGDEILLVERGQGLADANGYWSTVNGFIDEDKPVAEIAANELSEELGLEASPAEIRVAKSYTLKSDQEKRAYIVFPCLIELSKKPEITLDWEHTDYAWIEREDLDKYRVLDDLHEAIDRALALD